MKKQLLTIALLAGALTASAGVNLVVSGQQQQSFAVGDIGKITFTPQKGLPLLSGARLFGVITGVVRPLRNGKEH